MIPPIFMDNTIEALDVFYTAGNQETQETIMVLHMRKNMSIAVHLHECTEMLRYIKLLTTFLSSSALAPVLLTIRYTLLV